MKLACQERLLPGETIIAKWASAAALGYEAIELAGTPGYGLAARLPELRAARQEGAVFSSVCLAGMTGFPGDFDAGRRRESIAEIASMLEVIAELGGAGVVTPAAYGMHSNRLPPYAAPRSEADDREVLVDSFAALAARAAALGVSVFLEPLNRYEDHMINRLDQAAAICTAVASPALRVMADTYHMNIEESDLSRALAVHAHLLGHVHLSDSNRLEPGKGHVDFAAVLRTLAGIGFAGYMAIECRLSGEAGAALGEAAALLRRLREIQVPV